MCLACRFYAAVDGVLLGFLGFLDGRHINLGFGSTILFAVTCRGGCRFATLGTTFGTTGSSDAVLCSDVGFVFFIYPDVTAKSAKLGLNLGAHHLEGIGIGILLQKTDMAFRLIELLTEQLRLRTRQLVQQQAFTQ